MNKDLKIEIVWLDQKTPDRRFYSLQIVSKAMYLKVLFFIFLHVLQNKITDLTIY